MMMDGVTRSPGVGLDTYESHVMPPLFLHPLDIDVAHPFAEGCRLTSLFPSVLSCCLYNDFDITMHKPVYLSFHDLVT